MRALRTARTNHQRQQAIALGLLPDTSTAGSTILIISRWSYTAEATRLRSSPIRPGNGAHNDLPAPARPAPYRRPGRRVARHIRTLPRRLIAERRIRFVCLGDIGKRGHVRIPESALREFIAARLVTPMTDPDSWRAA